MMHLARFIDNAEQHCRPGFDWAQSRNVVQQAEVAQRGWRRQHTHHLIMPATAHCQAALQATEQRRHSLRRWQSESSAQTSVLAHVAAL